MNHKASEITWGSVVAASPLTVTFAGDTVPSPVGLKDSSLTLVAADKVILARVGKPFGWAVISKLGAS
tara:strand:+ start:726 stop:929 length:204 start_codon:yes stop_codon:yes gene_type:complete